MNTEITSQALQKLAYRQDRLRDRLRQMESILSGRTGSFLYLVRNEKDQFDEGRAQALIGRLLEAFQTHLRLSSNEISMDGALSPEDEALYRGFLYCAIRYAECPPGWEAERFGGAPLYEARGTYEDLLMLARKAPDLEKTSLHYYECYEPYEMDHFFGYMDSLYERLMDCSIQSTISEADQLAMREVYQSDIAAWEEFANMEPPDWDDEMWEDYIENQTPEDEAAAEAEREMWERDVEEHQKALADWMAAFREKEQFCRQYLLLREVYFKAPARRTLAQDVERMLEILLLQTGESNYLDDELFYGALTLLDQAAGSVKRRLSAGR